MSEQLTTWERKHYVAGAAPFLFYVVFGDINTQAALKRRVYRSEGIPEGLELQSYDADEQPDVLGGFRQGYLWEQLVAENEPLAAEIASARNCLVLQGSPADPTTLDYLRDTIGLLTFFLDQGGCTVYDPQMFQWWGAERWREVIFEPAAPLPKRHTVILVSEEKNSGLSWFHTRGMRKFGRPDISVHNVEPHNRDAVVGLCNRFIEFQAFGGIVEEEQEIEVTSLPAAGRVHHKGHIEDPDFNNVHFEISWPRLT